MAGDAAPLADETAAIQEFCLDFADKAAEARTAWLAANLDKLRDDVTAKIGELEKKRLEVQGWVETQRAMLLAANQGLVDIYAKMDAEAAAILLGEIDVKTAVSILRQLKPRDASAVLTVMEPAKAAVLVKAIAAALQDQKPGRGT